MRHYVSVSYRSDIRPNGTVDGGAGCDSRDNEQRMETVGRVQRNARNGWRSDADRSGMEEKLSALSGKASNH